MRLLGPANARAAFFRRWARTEAWLKATGHGLAGPQPFDLDASLAAAGQLADVDIDPGYAAAVACAKNNTPLQLAIRHSGTSFPADLVQGPAPQPVALNPASCGTASSRARRRSARTAPARRGSASASAMPTPLSIAPRTMRSKWVTGMIVPSHCAHSRHAAEREQEARQQDRRQDVEERHLHRLQLVARQRRDQEAERQAADDEQDDAERSAPPSRRPSARRTAAAPATRMTAACTSPTQHIGRELADHHLERPHRRRQQASPSSRARPRG